MNHFSICITVALLLFSPAAIAQSTPDSVQGAANLQLDISLSSRVAQSESKLQSQESSYWNSQASPDWHLEQQDLGIQFSRGPYHGNRGPASEEQGIQLEFLTR